MEVVDLSTNVTATLRVVERCVETGWPQCWGTNLCKFSVLSLEHTFLRFFGAAPSLQLISTTESQQPPGITANQSGNAHFPPSHWRLYHFQYGGKFSSNVFYQYFNQSCWNVEAGGSDSPNVFIYFKSRSVVSDITNKQEKAIPLKWLSTSTGLKTSEKVTNVQRKHLTWTTIPQDKNSSLAPWKKIKKSMNGWLRTFAQHCTYHQSLMSSYNILSESEQHWLHFSKKKLPIHLVSMTTC